MFHRNWKKLAHQNRSNLTTLLIEEYHMSEQTKQLFAQAPGLSDAVRRQFG